MKTVIMYSTLLGALGALGVLIYSMFLDAARHKACNCPTEEDPSFIWYPVRWGLVCLLSLVAAASFSYLTLHEWASDLTLLVNFSAVALGWTYGLTLLNPRLSVTSLASEAKNWVRRVCSH